jgi:hypothetical protein
MISNRFNSVTVLTLITQEKKRYCESPLRGLLIISKSRLATEAKAQFT